MNLIKGTLWSFNFNVYKLLVVAFFISLFWWQTYCWIDNMQNKNDQRSMAQASKISSHSSAYASSNTTRTKNDISLWLGVTVNYQGVLWIPCLLLFVLVLDIKRTEINKTCSCLWLIQYTPHCWGLFFAISTYNS